MEGELRGLCGYQGVRVGEASNPGPRRSKRLRRASGFIDSDSEPQEIQFCPVVDMTAEDSLSEDQETGSVPRIVSTGLHDECPPTIMDSAAGVAGGSQRTQRMVIVSDKSLATELTSETEKFGR